MRSSTWLRAVRVAAFGQDVIAHAQPEERAEFSRLAEALDQSQLERMRWAVVPAEKIAPTHRQHPGPESAGENLMAGCFAAMLERASDVITGKR